METTISRQIGQAIRKRRKELGLTQSELAERAHVDRSFVIRIESGKSKSLYPDKLLQVLHALDLKMVIEPKERPLPPEAGHKTPEKKSERAIAAGKGTEKKQTRIHGVKTSSGQHLPPAHHAGKVVEKNQAKIHDAKAAGGRHLSAAHHAGKVRGIDESLLSPRRTNKKRK